MSNVLCLVIAHRHPIMDEWVKVWKARKKHPNVEMYFVYADPSLSSEIDINEATKEIRVKGEESIYPGILNKTLKAMEWALSDECPVTWDWLLRSNISSFWDFGKFARYLKVVPNDRSLVGCLQHWLGTPQDDPYNYFISGCGFTCSKDLIEDIVKNKDYITSGAIPARSPYDDVILSQYLLRYGEIRLYNYEIEMCKGDEDLDKMSGFHIRVYSESGDERTVDLERYKRLIERFDEQEQ